MSSISDPFVIRVESALAMSSLNLENLLDRFNQVLDRVEKLLPVPLSEPDWNACAFRYRKKSSGAGVLMPVRHIAEICLDDLKEIDSQKERLVRNTRQFVDGLPANNVLLSGSRGTGKSSLIRACLGEFKHLGLRLIEVDKDDLTDLPDIMELIANRPEKFMIYCDDLSFEAGEAGYKALKSILDGSISGTGANVLIYATSNRRHLLPESLKENLTYKHTEDGEIHPGEGIEEKISLSERFGMWISFYPFSQDEYLAVVAQWLKAAGLDDQHVESARAPALVWALERGSRSGRVAAQFARDWVGQAKLQSSAP